MLKYFEDTVGIIEKALYSIDAVTFNRLVSDIKSSLKANKKVVVSGLGKNVPICEKFVGSMISLGLNANFLHTNSAVHGDLGMVHEGDVVIILTKSGTTEESVRLAELLKKRKGVNIWLLTFRKESILVDMLSKDKCIIVDLEHEGDLWNIMPNNSTTINLIVLQAIVMQLAEQLDLTLDHFKCNHPGGAIGEQLNGK